MLVKEEFKSYKPTKLASQVQHKSATIKSDDDDSKKYQKFKEIYSNLKQKRQDVSLDELIKTGDVISYTLNYYNERKQIVRKEQFYGNNLAYYFLYYYQNDQLVKKELYTESHKIDRIYKF